MSSNSKNRYAASFAALTAELSIKCLEVNDLNFEFVFLEHLGQDGSGEKGFESLN